MMTKRELKFNFVLFIQVNLILLLQSNFLSVLKFLKNKVKYLLILLIFHYIHGSQRENFKRKGKQEKRKILIMIVEPH